ncbi:MAG: hypothetical protein JJE30_18665 [Desulfuromonadales bacterium]|nr:hypothetical protein [Desulfuromonadales bacterium]
MKLGESLINEGLITQEQLDEALKCHVIFGVKLGSSLIELGFVQEDALLDLLSRKLGVPSVTHEELLNVPSEAIERMTPALAEKFRVIPVRLENKRLYVAMSDPTDFKTQEELSFITGNVIIPNIAADIQILYALEKYYGVKLDHRYMSASCELQKIRIKNKEAVSDEFVFDDSKYTISAEYEVNAVTGALLDAPVQKAVDSEPAEQEPVVPPAPTVTRTSDLYSIDKLCLDFSQAILSDDVADLMIKYLRQDYTTCALLAIRKNSAVGWKALVNGKESRDFEEITIDLSDSQEISDLLAGKQLYFGALSETSANLPVIMALKLPRFNPVLLLPVVMNERVVVVLVVSADEEVLQRKLSELQKLVNKASLIFQILVLKTKLLQT